MCGKSNGGLHIIVFSPNGMAFPPRHQPHPYTVVLGIQFKFIVLERVPQFINFTFLHRHPAANPKNGLARRPQPATRHSSILRPRFSVAVQHLAPDWQAHSAVGAALRDQNLSVPAPPVQKETPNFPLTPLRLNANLSYVKRARQEKAEGGGIRTGFPRLSTGMDRAGTNSPPLHYSTTPGSVQYLAKSLYFMIPAPQHRLFLRVMCFFAANQLKFLSMNHLQLELRRFQQTKSNQIKAFF
jgi:hypothetical protein